MILNTFLCVFATAIFIICSFIFIAQALYALDFRKKIALSHGFSEAVMSGPSYPIFIISFSLLFLQFVAFWAFAPVSEFSTIIRVFAYVTNVIIFFYFKFKTPPLLAYWLGKSCLWIKSGCTGKIPYSDVYCIKMRKKTEFPITDAQKLFKVTFYIKESGALSYKKLICRVSAYDLSVLSKQITLLPYEKKVKEPSKAASFSNALLPLFIFFICILSFLVICSSGIFNQNKYVHSDTPLSSEIKTVTEVTLAEASDGKIAVYHGKIGAVNVYDSSGNFAYALSLENSGVLPTALSITEGKINYRFGDTIYKYDVSDGHLISREDINEDNVKTLDSRSNSCKVDYNNIYVANSDGSFTKAISRPAITAVFNIEFIWTSLAVLILTAFILHFLGARKKED